ncbi:snf7 domain-containing protein [Ditylenchus destructor]|uniref:Snf7 domain-containing protein n=1 Tax=Ditylenchus destructor TaxID=166010 RepID=A0AAD4NEN1_9BILA|nr:snf7 domain-containing protein [Ditylenchus destructor]
MNYIFGNKPTEREQARTDEKQLRTANRGLSTDFRQLELKEKQLEAEIKKLAKAGHKDACKVLAKQLVQIRQQKTKNINTSATISSVSSKNRQMRSMNNMSKAIGSAAQTMQAVDKQMPIAQFAKDMRDFAQTQDKMDLREEVISDTLDSMLEVEEGEEERVINQVLDEIGIETNKQLDKVPRVHDSLGETSKASRKEDVDLDRLLAQLKN